MAAGFGCAFEADSSVLCETSKRGRKGTSMTAEELIQTLNLVPHPEGGWYRETYRSTADPGERGAATAVYYVIQPGQHSHWNRVDADEMWLWHAGDPLDLMIADSDSGP